MRLLIVLFYVVPSTFETPGKCGSYFAEAQITHGSRVQRLLQCLMHTLSTAHGVDVCAAQLSQF